VQALAPIGDGELMPLAGFLLNNIDTLRFIGMGVLLILLVQRRPEGLLGARKETAAAVSLDESTRPGTTPERTTAAADGGEADE